jgi:phosphomevalonate kinase
LLVGWTGTPASTATLVQRYLAARNGGAAKRAVFVQDSRACVAMFLQALGQGTVSEAALNSNGDIIEQLGAALGMTLATSRLRTLVALARQQGAGAKLSGAGGGDCGIALTRQPAVADRIRDAWRAAGIVPLDLGFDHAGVSLGHA